MAVSFALHLRLCRIWVPFYRAAGLLSSRSDDARPRSASHHLQERWQNRVRPVRARAHGLARGPLGGADRAASARPAPLIVGYASGLESVRKWLDWRQDLRSP